MIDSLLLRIGSLDFPKTSENEYFVSFLPTCKTIHQISTKDPIHRPLFQTVMCNEKRGSFRCPQTPVVRFQSLQLEGAYLMHYITSWECISQEAQCRDDGYSESGETMFVDMPMAVISVENISVYEKSLFQVFIRQYDHCCFPCSCLHRIWLVFVLSPQNMHNFAYSYT